jgi:pyruvate ferredoxin oxidoreductase delta subunit
VVEKEQCIRCGVCWLYCPDAAINRSEEGHFEADLDYCKGCGICARECPVGCITMEIEEG